MQAQSFVGRFASFSIILGSVACSSSSPSTTGSSDAGADSATGATPTPSPTPTSTPPSDDAGAAPVVVDSGTPAPPAPPTPPGSPPVQWMSVVGNDGFFGQTFDEQTWAGRSIAAVSLLSVACEDNVHGWASGERGYLAHTANGGQSWSLQTSHLTGDLHAINFGWSTHGVVAGDSGALAVTQDGETWTAIAPLTSVALRGAAVAPYVKVMLVVGDAGTVLRSADYGLTWTRTAIAGAGDFHGVTSDAWAGTVLAVDSLGAIWSSRDAGLTFAREGAAGVSLDAVSTTQAGGRALAAGKGGVVLLRSAQGQWAQLGTGNGADLHAALVAGDGSRFYVAGERGTLLTSTDLGAHWVIQPLGTSSALYGLQDL